MKTLTKMFLLCCWCMFSIGFAKQHIDQIQENSEQQAIEEKLTYEEVEKIIDDFKMINSKTSHSEIKKLLQKSISSPLTPKDNIIDIHTINQS